MCYVGRLAVGVGDCLIRVWNHDNSLNKFDVQTFWQGIKAKVTAVSHHVFPAKILVVVIIVPECISIVVSPPGIEHCRVLAAELASH